MKLLFYTKTKEGVLVKVKELDWNDAPPDFYLPLAERSHFEVMGYGSKTALLPPTIVASFTKISELPLLEAMYIQTGENNYA